MKVSFKPFIMGAWDSHDFYYFQRNLKQAGIEAEFEEVGFNAPFYYAVVWVSGDEKAAFQFMMTNKMSLDFANGEIN